MGRKLVALCAAALLAATAACGPFDDDGPERHRVLLPDPAPAPTPATPGVLDSDDQEHRYAVAFWLLDDVDVCWVVVNPTGNREVGQGPMDGMAKGRPMPADQTPGHDSYAFAVLPGRVDGLYATGTGHLLGPLRSRVADLGGGRSVTFASYGIRLPEDGESVTVRLCPRPAAAARAACPTSTALPRPPSDGGDHPRHGQSLRHADGRSGTGLNHPGRTSRSSGSADAAARSSSCPGTKGSGRLDP